MSNQNSNNQDYQNNVDGAQLGGGVIKRILKWLGSDITLTGSGTAELTFPAASDTLVGRATIDTLTNKDLSDSTNTFPSYNVQNFTTNATIAKPLVQTGWGYEQGTGIIHTPGLAVTFPVAFSGVPYVVVAAIGYKDTSAPTSITDFSTWPDVNYTLSVDGTTSFTATGKLVGDSETIVSTRYVGFSWIAIGPA